MNYIEIPNLPQGPVKVAIIDGRVSRKIEEKISDFGITLLKTHKHPGVYEAISYHPDIMIHHIGKEDVVYAPGTHPGFLGELCRYGFKLIEGSTPPGLRYPANIAYNAARVGKLVFHNLKHTDPVLKRELERAGVELVHVSQGYAKCSIAVIDENCIITSDTGIARAAEAKGVEVLLIEPEEHILLPGLSCGFIGGSSGLIDKSKWVVTGNIETFKSFHKIFHFLSAKGIEIISASDEQVVDLGSIIPILTK